MNEENARLLGYLGQLACRKGKCNKCVCAEFCKCTQGSPKNYLALGRIFVFAWWKKGRIE